METMAEKTAPFTNALLLGEEEVFLWERKLGDLIVRETPSYSLVKAIDKNPNSARSSFKLDIAVGTNPFLSISSANETRISSESLNFTSQIDLGSKNTTSPAYVFNLTDVNPVTGKDPNYQIIPLLTVGDEIPLLEGEFGSFSASSSQTYAMAGIPDGLGVSQIGDYYYVWMNHELGDDVTTDISSTISGQINGARVSLLMFDLEWNVIGGKNLIETVDVEGTAYNLNTVTGNYEDGAGNALNLSDHNNFSRFCSGYLADSGFVDDNGNEIPIWFAPEEVDGGYGIAVTANGRAIPLNGLGIYAKEQVYATSQYRATNSDRTVLLSTEDTSNGEVYMYVGQQTAANPNGFTNNPDEFDLYVLQIVDPTTGEVFSYETMPENRKLIGRWTLVPDEVALGSAEDLSNWVDATDEGGNFRSTNLRRPEDIHEDPNNPGTFYFVTTGRNDIPPGSEEPDNAFGKLHRFTLNPDDPTGDMTFEFLMGGGENTGVSYDNMTIDRYGNILIQEDATAGGEDVLNAQQRNGRVISYNIAFNEGRAGYDEITYLFELDQSAEGSEFDTEFGAWETSGIVEIPGNFNGTSGYLFDVQAHTIENGSGVYEGAYEEGGQLILTLPTQAQLESPEFVFGTGDDDILDAIDSNTFDGNRDILLTGRGEDVVDASQAVGSNRIYLGSEDDIFTGGSNNYVSGGSGDDRFFLGEDIGNNQLTGDSGSDEFWVVTSQTNLPAIANIITDFSVKEGDVIGFADTRLTYFDFGTAWNLTQRGENAIISVFGREVAILLDTQANNLTEDSFVFA